MKNGTKLSISITLLSLGIIHCSYASPLEPKDWDAATYDYSFDEQYLAQAPTNGINWALGVWEKPSHGSDPHIKIQMDHASFDKHFAHEKAKPRIADRDDHSPGGYCEGLSLEWFWQGSPFGYDESCKAASEDVRKRVHTIECRLSETGEPRIDIQGDTMVVTQVPNKVSSYSWMESAYRNAVPSYKQCRENK